MTTKTERADKTPDEALALAADEDERARIAQILEMGLVTDMISVDDGEPDRRYVWVRERDVDIKKYNLLGYRVETDVGDTVHGTGDNRRRVGDVVLMSCGRERYELIQSVQQERKDRRYKNPVKEYMSRAKAASARGQAATPWQPTEKE